MTRFRLKFPQQEIHLRPGDTLIGRSPSCTITIEDALVSREHALLRVSEAEVTYEDLASRNGSRINGKLTYLPTALRHGDVITIGKHEIHVSTEPDDRERVRSTSFLRSCSSCGLPYAAEAGSCPHCESADYIEEPPVTVQFTEPAWALDMLSEMLLRAIALGRAADIRRITQRAVVHVDEQLASGLDVDRKQLDALVEIARGALSPDDAGALASWTKSLK